MSEIHFWVKLRYKCGLGELWFGRNVIWVNCGLGELWSGETWLGELWLGEM